MPSMGILILGHNTFSLCNNPWSIRPSKQRCLKRHDSLSSTSVWSRRALPTPRNPGSWPICFFIDWTFLFPVVWADRWTNLHILPMMCQVFCRYPYNHAAKEALLSPLCRRGQRPTEARRRTLQQASHLGSCRTKAYRQRGIPITYYTTLPPGKIMGIRRLSLESQFITDFLGQILALNFLSP